MFILAWMLNCESALGRVKISRPKAGLALAQWLPQTNRGFPTLALLLFFALVPNSGHAATSDPAQPGLSVVFDNEGLKSLAFAGNELLVEKSSPLVSVKGVDGKSIMLALNKGGATQVNSVLTRVYEGLMTVTRIQQMVNNLNMTVTFKNTGKQAISSVEYQPMILHFPRRPNGGRWKWGYAVTVDIEDALE